jgi:hypothetical protein
MQTGFYPEGITYFSPGLPVLRSATEGGRGTSYPGVSGGFRFYPARVESRLDAVGVMLFRGCNPCRVENSTGTLPRVAPPLFLPSLDDSHVTWKELACSPGSRVQSQRAGSQPWAERFNPFGIKLNDQNLGL